MNRQTKAGTTRDGAYGEAQRVEVGAVRVHREHQVPRLTDLRGISETARTTNESVSRREGSHEKEYRRSSRIINSAPSEHSQDVANA